MGDRKTEALLAWLERRRRDLDMSHNVFARTILHMNQATWSRVRRGEVAAGPAFIGRVVAALPEAMQVIHPLVGVKPEAER